MAVVKYDVSNVQAGGGGEQPQPGLYAGTIQSMEKRTEKANGDPVRDLVVVVSVGSEYANLWTYIKTPDDPNYNETAHGWKLRELTDALKLAPKGQMDTAKMIGKKVNAKVVADTNLEGEYRGRIRSLYAPGKIEEDGDGLPAGGVSDSEEPLTEEELKEWSVEDIKEEMTANDIPIPRGRFNRAAAIAAIIAAQGASEPDGEEPEEQGSNGSGVLDPELAADLRTDSSFYDDWEDDDLKQFVEDLGIAGNISGRKTRAKVIGAIVALAEAAGPWQEGAGNGSGEAGPEDDYDEWSLEELTEEVSTRNEQEAGIEIAGRKTKEKLIAALREDDKVAEPF
jgi:hypothetical protein